jgi:hypothetical protein
MSDGPGRIERSRDMYKVHDSSKKQKKERRAGDEKEFLELLEESDRDLEGYEQEKPARDQSQQQPTKSLLDRLSTSAPPPIQFVDDPDNSSKDGPA